MLSFIASMYDPLGLVAPCSVTGKMIFQDATRLKIGWDEEVPGDVARRWRKWMKSLEDLNDMSFARCITTSEEDVQYEVHNFADASQKGYGCCSYLRSMHKDGSSKMCLIMSKGRVCPMKQVSIPRLELQAALLAAQMNDVVSRELDLLIQKSYFWSDSQIVLAYIKNQKKRLKVYVANRVEAILSLSDAEQWNYIEVKINPADHVSRGVSPEVLEMSNWKEGPDLEEVMKFEEVSCVIPDDDVEVRSEKIVRVTRKSEFEDPMKKITEYFSDWNKMKKSVAWLMKIKNRFRGCKVEKKITVEEMKEAEKMIIKYVQEEKFEEEIRSLRKDKEVGVSSSIRSLMPVMNEDGIICVGGRLKNMKNTSVCKHPCILPYDHQVTQKIVRECHERAHQGTEWTLSMLRKKFWVTRSRRVIRSVQKKCVACKKMFGRPVYQQMADLPAGRLEQDEKMKPFAHVGIDCFGPFYVKQGRAEVKRYGCVFTCMNLRAVHIEKLNSLETDTFINAFRRFMARRGNPVKVWSDNGTNFVGGSPEILKCMKSLNQRRIEEVNREVEWFFNTPYASHMGGVWERQIRTIRKILTSLLNKYAEKLTDEVLETLFAEVESMINSRPLTKLSDDVTDDAALSANQLLMLNEEMAEFPGNFSSGDRYKQRWRFIQHLANQFWRRWIREYIPELQKRNKWNMRQKNVEVGDVVLLLEENTPRCLWPLGLVVEVKKGRDGLVRTVKIKTKSSILIRPVSKVVNLECSE